MEAFVTLIEQAEHLGSQSVVEAAWGQWGSLRVESWEKSKGSAYIGGLKKKTA